MLKYELVDNQKQDWVVFVHGIAGSTLTWKKQVDDFSEKYNLLLLDLPGHGSNADNTIKKVDINKLNNGIKDTLDHVGIQKAHFVGMSLGTIVIASFATTYPQYIKSIVFGGAALAVNGIYRGCVRFVNGAKRILPYESMYKFFAWFMMPKQNHKKSRQIFIREAKKLDRKTMLAWIEYLTIALKPKAMIEKMAKLKLKVMFISGDEDHCFIGGTKTVIGLLKKANCHIIKHCGHICTIERAKEFNEYALKYIEAVA